MKIARLETTPIQTSSAGFMSNYFVVHDNHVFPGSPAAVDVTSVETLFTFSQGGAFDFSVFRSSLMTNMIPQWANMLYEDRKKCVQYYNYPTNISNDEFNSYFSPADTQANWNMLTANVRATRLQRLFAAFNKVSFALTTTQVMLIYMATKPMLIDYYYANLPHVLFWIQNQAYPPLGIDFRTNGFAQMSGYTPTLEYEMLDILVNGNYQNAEKQIIIF